MSFLGGNHGGHAGRTIDHAQGLLAAPAADDPHLFSVLSRPYQCRLCRADHEQGPGAGRRHLRPGGRNLFLGLFPVRGAEQYYSGKSRCATVDRPHHGELGRAVRRHGILRRAMELFDHALFARPCRSRAFPGPDSVFHLLVPGLAPGARRFGVHGGVAGGSRRGLAGVYLAARARWSVRARRLEVDVHRRSGADGSRRNLHLVLRYRSAQGCEMAQRRRTRLAQLHA